MHTEKKYYCSKDSEAVKLHTESVLMPCGGADYRCLAANHAEVTCEYCGCAYYVCDSESAMPHITSISYCEECCRRVYECEGPQAHEHTIPIPQ